MTSDTMELNPLHGIRRVLSHQPMVMAASLLFLTVMLVCAIGGEYLTPYDATLHDLSNRLLPPGSTGPEGRYWFGTEALGRDVLSLSIMGVRPALVISLIAVLIGMAGGMFAGIFAGYRGGRFGDLLIILTNLQLSFPFFLLAITIVGILRPSVPLVIAVLALGSWVRFARVTYSDTMQIKNLEYIEAVHVMRGTGLRVLLRHILPNVLPNVLVLSTFTLGTVIVMESGLSFIGLGVPTDTPTWGRMLSEGRDYMQTAWWLTVVPGVCIFLLVLAINIVGEQLRDLADPKLSL